MFNKKKIEELENELVEVKKQLYETKDYLRAKNRGENYCIKKVQKSAMLLGDDYILFWTDDDKLKLCSAEIPCDTIWVLNEFEIYENNKKEIFVKHDISLATFNDPKKRYEYIETRYYKLNKKESKLERVYFEGKKSTLGKKIWG